MSGAPLSQYLAWALWVKKVFHPDLLVITIIGNDFDESLLRYKHAPCYHYFDDSRVDIPLILVDKEPGYLQRITGISITKSSALLRYLKQNVGLSAIVQRFRSPNVIQYVGNVPAAVEADRIERSKQAVDVFLARLSQETGIPVSRIILVVDGMRTELYSEEGLRKAQGSYFDTMRRYFITQAIQRGYMTIDMQPRFIERHRATGERFEYPDDGHWNEMGHVMVAEAIKAAQPFQELFGF